MVKKTIVTVGILLLGISIGACQKKENKDLFEQQQEQHLLAAQLETPAGEQDGYVAADQESSEAQDTFVAERKDALVAENQDAYTQEEPSTFSIEEQNFYFAPEQEASLENETEGEAMATIQQKEQPLFYYEEITDEIKVRILGKSYGETCDIAFTELRYVKVLHWGFDGQTHSGELIVNESIAENVVDIFKELFELEYQIERMVLVDEYDADDNASMAANNSSAFNYRKIDGVDRLSLHSYGMAIDINPLYNPYVREKNGEIVVTPEQGDIYADRTIECTYYISHGDPCYQAFTERGFTWGGDWKNQKDYQHFQKAR